MAIIYGLFGENDNTKAGGTKKLVESWWGQTLNCELYSLDYQKVMEDIEKKYEYNNS